MTFSLHRRRSVRIAAIAAIAVAGLALAGCSGSNGGGSAGSGDSVKKLTFWVSLSAAQQKGYDDAVVPESTYPPPASVQAHEHRAA